MIGDRADWHKGRLAKGAIGKTGYWQNGRLVKGTIGFKCSDTFFLHFVYIKVILKTFFKQISLNCPASLYILPTLIFSTIYNLPRFCELEVTSNMINRNTTEVENNKTTDLLLEDQDDETHRGNFSEPVMVSN